MEAARVSVCIDGGNKRMREVTLMVCRSWAESRAPLGSGKLLSILHLQRLLLLSRESDGLVQPGV